MSDMCEQGAGVQSECGREAIYSVRIIRSVDGWIGISIPKCVRCATEMMLRMERLSVTRRVELTLLDSE